MKRRTVNVMGLTAVTSLAVAGCSSGGSGSAGDGPIPLHIQINAPDSVPSDDPVGEALNEALDIELTLTSTSGDDYWTQLSADLAGGGAPDLFEVNRTRLQQYIDQGLVLDLTEYMDNELSTYYNNADQDSLRMAQSDGADYGIIQRPTFNYRSYWIRKDWLDNLGLAIPTTVDEFRDVLIAFTEDDPDGNGHNDTYGLGGSASGQMWNPLWAAFGSGGISGYGETGGSFYLDGTDIVNGLEDPRTIDALEYIQSLVADGVVDPDFLTLDGTQAHERAMQGVVGVIEEQWPMMTKPEFVRQYREAQPDAEWVQINPLSGPGGDGAYPRDLSGSVRMEAIPSSLVNEPERLERLFELINYVSEGEGERLVSFGIEGEHYEMDGEDVVPTELLDEEGGYFFLYQIAGRNEEEYLEVKFERQWENVEFAEEQPAFETFNSLVIPPEGYQMADAGRFAEENLIEFVAGGRSLDEYPAFLDELRERFDFDEFVQSGIEQLQEAGVDSEV